MADEWFRWVLGVLNGIYLLVLGWLVNTLAVIQREHRDLDKRLTVIESRPQVDPLVYVKAVAEMTAALREIQIAQNQMRAQLDAIKDELDLLAQKVRAVA